MADQIEAIRITYPTPNTRLNNVSVPVSGTCSTPGMTIAVSILTGTVTVQPVQTVVAGSPTATWATTAWTLSSRQSYVAAAQKASDPGVTAPSVPFSES